MGKTIKTKNCPETHLDVTAGVIYKDGKLLITQRKDRDRYGGFWEFPGGKLNPGESLTECLIREIIEELDIQIDVQNHLISLKHGQDDFTLILHAFYCVHVKGTPKKIEVQDWKWIDPSELPFYNFTEVDRILIQKLPRLLEGIR